MTIVARDLPPLVLLYQGWSFHVFRARVKAPPEQAGAVTTPAWRRRRPANRLRAAKLREASAASKQLGVGAAFEHAAAFEHEHLVDLLEPGQTVRDQQRRAVSRDGEQVGDDRVGRRRIEMLAGLVEDQHGKSASRARAIARRCRCPPDIRAPRSPTSVSQARRAARRPSRSSRTRGERARSSSSLASRVRGGGSPRACCRRCARPGRRGRPRAVLIAVERRRARDAVERDRARLRRGGTAAAPPRASTSRAARPDDGHAPAGAQVEVESVERPASLARVAERSPRTCSAGPAGAGAIGCAGSAAPAARVQHLQHARGRAPHALQGLGCGGQAARAQRPRAGSARSPASRRVQPSRMHAPRRRRTARPTSPSRAAGCSNPGRRRRCERSRGRSA